MSILANYISIVTVTYANKAEAIASQALAETMMEKIALDNGCSRVRCYLSGESTRMILFEYQSEESQKKVVESLIEYSKIHTFILILLVKRTKFLLINVLVKFIWREI